MREVNPNSEMRRHNCTKYDDENDDDNCDDDDEVMMMKTAMVVLIYDDNETDNVDYNIGFHLRRRLSFLEQDYSL